MAIVKHIKSRNANYSDAINYLLFEHDEKSGKKIVDESGRSILRKEFYMDGLKPTSTVFQKDYLRNAIDECAATSDSFDEFQTKLLEQFQISVVDHRGRYSYLHPDRQKRITERALGTRYGKEHLEQIFLHKDPIAILYVRSHLRLVVDLQTNVKTVQSPAYARRVKLTNLQQMANTIIYVQEHGIDTQTELKRMLLDSQKELDEYQNQLAQHLTERETLNSQLHKTIYQICREEAGLTRSEASEKMSAVSDSKIEKFEYEMQEPTPYDTDSFFHLMSGIIDSILYHPIHNKSIKEIISKR